MLEQQQEYKSADEQYNNLVQNILDSGKWDSAEHARTVYADGEKATTKSVINVQLKFDNSGALPMLTTKRVPQKDPMIEAFWIWQKMSNDVNLLNEMGCKVWDEWKDENGTIGKSYGWQLLNKTRPIKVDSLFVSMYLNGEFFEKPTEEDLIFGHDLLLAELSKAEYTVYLNQVDYLLYSLKKNPYSRRIKTTLYCVEDLDEMALEPCVYETHWQLWDGKLHLTVNIRSNDLALGNPYNCYQYAVIHRLIAQVTGHQTGEICFNIDNAHIYDRHIETIAEQIKNPILESPTLWINPEITSFYDFTLEDIKVQDYVHGGNYNYEIAI